MCDSTSQSDGLCGRCSHFLHFKGGEHGFYAETTDEDGTVHIDFDYTRDGEAIWEGEGESQFQLEDDYPAMTKLKRSASKGCGFCGLLLNAIQEEAEENMDLNAIQEETAEVGENMVLLIKEGNMRNRASFGERDYNAGVLVYWVVTDSKTKDEPLQLWSDQTFFRLLASHNTMAAKYLRLFHAPFNPSLLCSENLAHIQRNLSHCSENHRKCIANRPTGHWEHQALPSRLLEISKDRKGYNIRLVQMKPHTSPKPGTHHHTKYAALSYCWGDQDFIKSTSENITDHYNTIALSKFPPGFQDTIQLCWGIGIFYLWIDSLCIIQDDQSDWDRESARMKDVYANASLTIVLASTSSPLEGLSNVSTECSSDVRVSYRLDNDNGPEITYFIQSPSSTKRAVDSRDLERCGLFRAEDNYERSIHRSEWINRGWTFQESYLSTRKLFICPGHTDFSCRTSSHLQGVLRICQPLRDLGFSGPRSGPADWYDLVSHYSGRKLSRSEDKLPAISAVASLMGEGHGDYVAGLWSKSLERGLLWAPPTSARLKRQTTYRGPTWSWCAYDGFISYDMIQYCTHFSREFDILEIRWTLAEPSAIHGRLSTADGDRAYLRIRAKVAWESLHSSEWFRGGTAGMEFPWGTTLIDCETEGFEGPQRVAAMLVATASASHGIPFGFGLLLRPIPSLGPVITYERVGCFSRDWVTLDIFTSNAEIQEFCLV